MKLFKKFDFKKVLPIWLIFASQFGLYLLTSALNQRLADGMLFWIPKTRWDAYVPLCPIAIVIYFYAFIYWISNGLPMSKAKPEHYQRTLWTMAISVAIGVGIFAFVPNAVVRSGDIILDYAQQNGFLPWAYREMIAHDGNLVGFNAFPSFHCMASVLCHLGISRDENISFGYRVYSLIICVAICASTLLTHQHYIPDVIGGVGIPLVIYGLVSLVQKAKRKNSV